jgi:hypothetical protein
MASWFQGCRSSFNNGHAPVLATCLQISEVRNMWAYCVKIQDRGAEILSSGQMLRSKSTQGILKILSMREIKLGWMHVVMEEFKEALMLEEGIDGQNTDGSGLR